MVKTTSKLISLALVLLLCCSAVFFGGCGNESSSSKTEKTTAAETTQKATVSSETIDVSALEGDRAIIDVKDYGVITVELYPDIAPKTVANFVKLAESGFYDGLTFHRIIKDFMIQGGDPLGNGTGGSDENIVGEFKANGFENNLSHTRGVISMARSNDMNSASSQFFIMHADSPHLDGQYAAFGKVTDGMDVVDKIANDAKPVDNNGTIPASQQPVINSIKIEKAP
ncbi:MAG: peptidylprolyl isomerase [Ruminococcus sp.]|nr:peptidylprolyl isomerase [Ruminococcus sp.]